MYFVQGTAGLIGPGMPSRKALEVDASSKKALGECVAPFDLPGDNTTCVYGLDGLHVPWEIRSEGGFELYTQESVFQLCNFG